MWTKRAVSSSVSRWTGMPVHWASTSAISSSSISVSSTTADESDDSALYRARSEISARSWSRS